VSGKKEYNNLRVHNSKQESLANAKVSARQPWYFGIWNVAILLDGWQCKPA